MTALREGVSEIWATRWYDGLPVLVPDGQTARLEFVTHDLYISVAMKERPAERFWVGFAQVTADEVAAIRAVHRRNGGTRVRLDGKEMDA